MEIGKTRKSGAVTNRYCTVFGCRNKQSKSVSLHLIPKKKDQRDEWVRILKYGKKLPKNPFVCSEHFLKSDYILPDVPSKRPTLKKNAVPSQKLPETKLEEKYKLDKLKRDQMKDERRKRYANRDCIRNMTVARVVEVSEDSQEEAVIANQNNEDVEGKAEKPVIANLDFNCQMWNRMYEEHNYGVLAKTKEVGIQVNFDEDFITKCDASVQANPVLEKEVRISIVNNINTNKQLNTCTGISTFFILEAIEKCIDLIIQSDKNYLIRTNSLLSIREKIILTFIKLKQDSSFEFLGILFGINPTTCINCYEEMVPILAGILRNAVIWPTRELNRRNMPLCFADFKDTRIVLDCTEVFLQKTKCLHCRISSYSCYKGNETFKILVGVAPSGLVIFVSKAFGGKSSDKAIVNETNVISKLEPKKDALMADKGFLVDVECLKMKIKLYRPPFLRNQNQFDLENARKSYLIANARVHVERAIQRLKIFEILQGKYPFQRLHDVDNIMSIIAGVVNLSRPIIANDKFIGFNKKDNK